MKKLIAFILSMTFMLALAGCSSDGRTEASTSNEANNPRKNTQSETGYFIPDYNTTNNLHCDEFLENLKSDGYIRGGEKDHCDHNRRDCENPDAYNRLNESESPFAGLFCPENRSHQ